MNEKEALEARLDRFIGEPDAAGHVEWNGPRNQGTPVFKLSGREYSAAAVAFERRTGRKPVGTCRADCGVKHCIADSHVQDDLERRSVRLQLRALEGLEAPWDVCPKGLHSWSEYGRVEPDLTVYCLACNTERARKSRANRKARDKDYVEELLDAEMSLYEEVYR